MFILFYVYKSFYTFIERISESLRIYEFYVYTYSLEKKLQKLTDAFLRSRESETRYGILYIRLTGRRYLENRQAL